MVLEDFKKRFRGRGRTALKVGAGILGAGVVGLGLAGSRGGATNPVQKPSPKLMRQDIDDLLKDYNTQYGTNLGNIGGIEQPTQKLGMGRTTITKTPQGATIID
mgnify:CR=1 FL=1